MKDRSLAITAQGVMILALLSEDDMHPYEMIRLLRQRRADRLIRITNGTIYHTVASLERRGLIAEIGIDREGNRPERTIYGVTESGRALVGDWVRRELPRTDRPNESRVAISELHNIPRAEAVELLSARRDALAAERRTQRAGLEDARARAVPEQYLVELERQTILLDAEVVWTDRLIARLRADELGWGAHALPSEHRPAYLEQRKAAQL